jgi:hypothetical protein
MSFKRLSLVFLSQCAVGVVGVPAPDDAAPTETPANDACSGFAQPERRCTSAYDLRAVLLHAALNRFEHPLAGSFRRCVHSPRFEHLAYER